MIDSLMSRSWHKKLVGLIVTTVLLQSCNPAGVLPFPSGSTEIAVQTQEVTPTPSETPTPTAAPTSEPTATPLPLTRIESGDKALFNGDWTSALSEYQSARSNSSEAEIQAAALLGIGRVQYATQEYSFALDTFRELISLYPDLPQAADAYFFLARTFEALQRYSEAAEAYQNYLARRSGVIDGYVLEWQGDAWFNAGNYSNAITDYQAALSSPRLEDFTSLQTKLARATAITGDYATAIVMYTDIYNRTTSDYVKAQMDYLLGQAYTATGQPDLANAAYLDAVENYPTAYDAHQSLIILVNNGYPVDELDRGLVDYYAGEYNLAVAAFDRYLSNNPVDPATAYYYRGLSLSAVGDYYDAISMWEVVINNYPESSLWDNAWEQKSYTQWAYLDEYDLAAQGMLDFVTTAPWHVLADEFLYNAGRIYERGGNLASAALAWERIPGEYPNSQYSFQSLFLAGICYFRQENYLAAQTVFDRLRKDAGTIRERSSAEFWMAKSLFGEDKDDEAKAALELTVSVDPTGYYSERARDMLAGRDPFTPPEMYDFGMDIESERLEAETWLRTQFFIPEDTNLSNLGDISQDGRVIRGSELWRLGMFAQARDEFENLRVAYESDPENTYRLANYFSEIGLYRSSILAARRVLALAGMDDAATINAPIYFNHLRFATYYSDLVIPEAQESGIHPLLLFSIIRQESFFESFAFSPAGASGLMQFMSATGQERANLLAWPPNYRQTDLLRPVVSITFGADYLSNLLGYLEGDIFAALAGYNGGPGNSKIWKDLSNGDQDLFLEIVRFEETRRYITTIYEVFTIYRRLYSRTP